MYIIYCSDVTVSCALLIQEQGVHNLGVRRLVILFVSTTLVEQKRINFYVRVESKRLGFFSFWLITLIYNIGNSYFFSGYICTNVLLFSIISTCNENTWYVFEVKETSTIQELVYGSDTFFFAPGLFTLIFPCAFAIKSGFVLLLSLKDVKYNLFWQNSTVTWLRGPWVYFPEILRMNNDLISKLI